MMIYTYFGAGDPVWVVEKYSHKRQEDGVTRRITDSGQIVLADGRRFTPRGEGHGNCSGALIFPAGRFDELVRKIRDRLSAPGGLEALSVVQLEKVARTLGVA